MENFPIGTKVKYEEFSMGQRDSKTGIVIGYTLVVNDVYGHTVSLDPSRFTKNERGGSRKGIKRTQKKSRYSTLKRN